MEFDGFWSLMEFGAVWCSLVEFGAVWWSLVEFGGVWWSLVEFGGDHRAIQSWTLFYP